MSFKVSVQPGGQSFTVAEGQTVLDAALDAGIVLPYSCRNGTCSSCMGKVITGDYDAGAAPQKILDQAELDQGYTLLCQAVPGSDLQIEATEVRMASDIITRKMPCRVMAINPLAADVIELVLQLPSAQAYNFLPGQYLEFLLPDDVRRSYSMACHQVQDHKISIHLRHVPGGLFTSQVFGVADKPLKSRDILRIEGPLGSFFLRDDIDKPIVFLASGTGIAPIKAIIESMIEQNDIRPVFLYWGGRSQSDLYLFDLAKSWQNQLADFTFVPVISDQTDGWSGRTGLVHQAILDDFADLSGYQVYACGNPLMVDAARTQFTKTAGLPREHFFADAFTTAADQVAS